MVLLAGLALVMLSDAWLGLHDGTTPMFPAGPVRLLAGLASGFAIGVVAALLGVAGGCFIGHGRSNVKALRNAILSADEFCDADLPGKIRDKLAEVAARA